MSRALRRQVDPATRASGFRPRASGDRDLVSSWEARGPTPEAPDFARRRSASFKALASLWLIGACAVRAPAPIDVGALVAKRGAIEAHRDLEIRVLADGRDVQARLALAELDVTIGRPGEALDELAAVDKLSGPLGTRWHDSDRERYAALLHRRGAARIAREAASALPDLERARQLGERVGADEIEAARVALAVTMLRHVDPEVRARGRAILDQVHWTGGVPWRAAAADWGIADPGAHEHGLRGRWLWLHGARREAYEQLAAWHAQARERPAPLEDAYQRALAWWTPDGTGPAVAVAEPPVQEPARDLRDPRAAAAARYASALVPGADSAALGAIADAYRRDPAVAERRARDLVAEAIDCAAAHAAVGALFDALDDPGRARPEWQAAVDGSPEPAFVRGLAEAAARGGDGAASRVFATRAAAAWGDPAIVWTAVARALDERALDVDALQAARSALELAGPDTRAAALAVAVAASRGLGRVAQADALAAQLAQLPARDAAADVRTAVAAHAQRPSAATLARLWVVSRAHPRDVETRATLYRAIGRDDPRRSVIAGELAALAGDPDRDVALAAVRALAF
jgi:hypothetical protein